VQRVGQNVAIRVAPLHHFAIHPDLAVAIIIASHYHPPARCRFAKIAPIWSGADIFLRESCDSVSVHPWNVNKTDISCCNNGHFDND
jgi:hypothetical protein